jgi:hypothetical protein
MKQFGNADQRYLSIVAMNLLVVKVFVLDVTCLVTMEYGQEKHRVRDAPPKLPYSIEMA